VTAPLIVFGGLPGTGKSTLARGVASHLQAAFVRVDELEAAMGRAGIAHDQPIGLAAYVVAETLAEACLTSGVAVVIDAVNAAPKARGAWRDLAARTGSPLRIVEVVCSDNAEHRRRVEARRPDIEGFDVPTWQDVLDRHYEPWSEPRLIVDTANDGNHVAAIIDHIRG
jgi:predicted kinase